MSGRGSHGVVKLCPIEMFARDVRTLLQLHGGQLALQHFEAAYAQHFGVALVPASYGFPNTLALLRAIFHVAVIRGRAYRRTVVLCRQFEGQYLPHLLQGFPHTTEGAASIPPKVDLCKTLNIISDGSVVC